MTTTIYILNIKNPNEITGKDGVKNKYKGSYKKIFQILNEESIFSEVYTDDEYLDGNDYVLCFEGYLEPGKLEKISKLKNVEIIED